MKQDRSAFDCETWCGGTPDDLPAARWHCPECKTVYHLAPDLQEMKCGECMFNHQRIVALVKEES